MMIIMDHDHEYTKYLEFLEYKKNQELKQVLLTTIDYQYHNTQMKYSGIIFLISGLIFYYLHNYCKKKRSVNNFYFYLHSISSITAFISFIWVFTNFCMRFNIQF